MDLADFERLARPRRLLAFLGGVIVAAAVGGMGLAGAHGGGHGASHGGMHAPPPPAIDGPPPQPPFTKPPPPVPVHTAFHSRDHGKRFADRGRWSLGAPWGWWPGYADDEDAYGPGGAGSVYVEREVARAEAPPPCPELLTWSPRLGRATSQRLCDDAPEARG